MENEKDSFWLRSLLGFFIGLAVIVPGVSGSTIAIIFRLYEKIIAAISNLIKRFKTSIIFLLPILLGGIVGFALGFISIQRLLDLIPFAIICLFAGLMSGALPSLMDEVRESEEKRGIKDIVLLVIGILIPISMAVIAIISSELGFSIDITVNVGSFLLFLLLGFILALTQFVPGCSATATLMALGLFIPLMETFHISYWQDNPSIFWLYGALVIGVLVGCIIISKTINGLLEKHKVKMYYLFIGLSIGSIVAMLCNVDMLDIYRGFINKDSFPFWEVALGIALLLVGFLVTFELVLYMRKRRELNRLK